MRDIVQVSVTTYNPSTGAISGGSYLNPVKIPAGDGFLDENGYLYDESEVFDYCEIWKPE